MRVSWSTPGTVAGFRIAPVSVGRELQIARVGRLGQEKARAVLMVYRPGTGHRVAGDPPGWDLTRTNLPGVELTRVRVGGAPGWFTANPDRSVLRWEWWSRLAPSSATWVPKHPDQHKHPEAA